MRLTWLWCVLTTDATGENHRQIFLHRTMIYKQVNGNNRSSYDVWTFVVRVSISCTVSLSLFLPTFFHCAFCLLNLLYVFKFHLILGHFSKWISYFSSPTPILRHPRKMMIDANLSQHFVQDILLSFLRLGKIDFFTFLKFLKALLIREGFVTLQNYKMWLKREN